jgi:hypothetical protein
LITEGDDNHTFELSADPFAELEEIPARFRFVMHPALPHFAGGAVGSSVTNTVRFFEPHHERGNVFILAVLVLRSA